MRAVLSEKAAGVVLVALEYLLGPMMGQRFLGSAGVSAPREVGWVTVILGLEVLLSELL